MRERVDVFTKTLLEAVESIHFIFRPTSCFVHDLARSILRRGGELTGLGLGFFLRLVNEALGHGDHGGDLFGSCRSTRSYGWRRGHWRCRFRTRRATRVELADALRRLAKLLALLLGEVFELANL